jgi:hypothetical protein
LSGIWHLHVQAFGPVKELVNITKMNRSTEASEP